MTILGRLALLFVVVPLLELAFLVQMGRWVGLLPTVALVFLTGIAGALLARAEGLRTLWAFRQELSSGTLPGQPLLDGLAILVGGALLLTPGFLTDIVGFVLLAPPTRRLVQRRIRRKLEAMIQEGTIRVVTSSPIFGAGWGAGPGGGMSGGSGPEEPGPGPGGRPHGTGPDRGSGGGGTGERERRLDPDKEIRQ